MHELVLKECRHLESSSIKSRVLSAWVRWVHGVEVDFCKVAMEVASNDFPAGVETVTIDPVLKFTTVQQLSGREHASFRARLSNLLAVRVAGRADASETPEKSAEAGDRTKPRKG